jgi:DNA repair protein RecO (recombination protein O)
MPRPLEAARVKVRRVEAFVLRSDTLGESDLLLSLFSLEEGKLRGAARGGRRSRRRFGGAFEPLTRVRVAFRETEGRSLARLDDLEIVRSFFSMQSDPRVAAACAYAVEIAEQFAREKEADPRFFRLLAAVAEGLDAGIEPFVAVRYLELWTLRLQGILPELGSCEGCGGSLEAGAGLASASGELRCRRCLGEKGGGTRISAAGVAWIAGALTAPLARVARARIEARELNAVGRLLSTLLQRFVERPFRAPKVLEEVSR